jgi:hypothetical protein
MKLLVLINVLLSPTPFLSLQRMYLFFFIHSKNTLGDCAGVRSF